MHTHSQQLGRLTAALLGIWASASTFAFYPEEATTNELQGLRQDVPGTPAESGLRYWQAPFRSIEACGSYVSVIVRDGTYELWSNTYAGDGMPASSNRVVVRRGPAIDRLDAPEYRLDTSLATDVFTPGTPDTLAPSRLYTRPYMFYEKTIGYVLMACVPPTYSPGSVTMVPTLTVSPSGLPGTWTYKGKIRGDVADETAKRVVWCDGGSIHHLEDGRWRMYANGFGPVMAALEAATLDGPWRFLRDDKGNIREMLTDFFQRPDYGRGCFPTVLRVGKDEWHAWMSDTWPVQSIWHFCSRDGLNWHAYGQQPEITRHGVHNHAIKCLRAYLDPNGKEIVGLLSVQGQLGEAGPAVPGPAGSEWVVHMSRMPVGLRDAGAKTEPAPDAAQK